LFAAQIRNTLKGNRHGRRDWLIGLVMFRHGLRATELCDLQRTDIDFSKSTVIIRRLKGSIDSNQYLTATKFADSRN
jgi:integrase